MGEGYFSISVETVGDIIIFLLVVTSKYMGRRGHVGYRNNSGWYAPFCVGALENVRDPITTFKRLQLQATYPVPIYHDGGRKQIYEIDNYPFCSIGCFYFFMSYIPHFHYTTVCPGKQPIFFTSIS